MVRPLPVPVLSLVACAAAVSGTLQEEDAQPLEVFIVPHSHQDVGWTNTIDFMYDGERQSIKNIYDTVVDELPLNPDRRFVSVEMFWLHRWWTDPNTTALRRSTFKSLLECGQIEFLNGGWVMQDDTSTMVEQDVRQLALGHEFIAATFGSKHVPRFAWHIDPFGPVGSSQTLFALHGFSAFVYNRIPDDAKTAWSAERTLNFVWRGTDSIAASRGDIMTHVLDRYGYCPPNTPRNWAFWDDYDFWGPQGGPAVNASNVKAYADHMVELLREQASVRATPHLLWPWGCDLEFHNASLQFGSMDVIIRYINQHPQQYGGMKAKYATPREFFEVLHSIPAGGQAEKQRQQSKKNKESAKVWPVRGPDLSLIPLALVPGYAGVYEPGVEMNHWSGIFTSRPALKKRSREASAALFAAERLRVLSMYRASPLITGQSQSALFSLRSASAELLHHDAIPGTCKPDVFDMYLADSSSALDTAMSDTESDFSSLLPNTSSGSSQPMLNASAAFLYDLLQSPSAASDGIAVPVFNPLGWPRAAGSVVSIQLTDPRNGGPVPLSGKISVTNALGQTVPAQLTDPHVPGEQLLLFSTGSGGVPAMGYNTFFITSKGVTPTKPSKSLKSLDNTTVTISNNVLRLAVDATSGQLKQIEQRLDNNTIVTTDLSISLWQYAADVNGSHTIQSDAYTFMPADYAEPLLAPAAGTGDAEVPPGCSSPSSVTVSSTGPIASEIRVLYDAATAPGCFGNTSVLVIMRLFHCGDQRGAVDVTLSVGPVGLNREVALRVKNAGRVPDGTFMSDESGWTSVKRMYDTKRTPNRMNNIAANTYPMVSSASVVVGSQVDHSDIHSPSSIKQSRLTLLSTFTHGVSCCNDAPTTDGNASLGSTALEVMLHRHVQNGFIPLPDHTIVDSRFLLLLQDTAAASSSLSTTKAMGHCLEHPLLPMFSRTEGGSEMWLRRYRSMQSPVRHGLPPSVHLFTLETPETFQPPSSTPKSFVRIRLSHMFGVGEHATLSNPVTVNITDFLCDVLHFQSWQEMTLSGAIPRNYSDKTRMQWATVNGDVRVSMESGTQKDNVNGDHHSSVSASLTEPWSTGPLVVTLLPLDIVTFHLNVSEL